ncbi:MAG: gamma-glutamylcyclotransferase family protein [Candidatus Helarchaeota archaeon]
MPDIVGYGTFIISHVRGDKTFHVKSVCEVIDHKRMYHPFFDNFQPFPYPFAIRRVGSRFKALLFEVDVDSLPALDHYEGVPRLYTRERCEVILENEKIKAEIYIPTKETWDQFLDRLSSIMTPMGYTKMNQGDLWLEYLNENFPDIKSKFPRLFE